MKTETENWYYMGLQDGTPVYSLRADGGAQSWSSRAEARATSALIGRRAVFIMRTLESKSC